MKATLGAALLAGLPLVTQAQTQVPPILAQADAAASASATVQPGAAPSDHAVSAPVSAPAGAAHQVVANTAAGVPATMPPPLHVLSPSAPLDAKEKQAVALSRRWRSRREMPQPGEDGYVRFLFGATLPTVVCAPLQVCNLSLQPGEIVNNVNVGDSVRWKITPSISGDGSGQTTHLIIKPQDAGLISSLSIDTNRRSYAIRLVSTQNDYMPLVGFNYPDDAQRQWSNYRQSVAFGVTSQRLGASSGENAANLQFLCISPASGGPGWTPLRAYTDGTKTYIDFPSSIRSQAAPALVALGNDGTWFSSPSRQVVNYRAMGNRYVVDAVLDRAALISGVGGGEQKVTISRGGGCR